MSEDNTYKDGDIVWVKLGNNWWPGEVISHEDRLPEGFNQLKRKPFCVVKFFQENAYEYPKNAKQIHPFQCSKKEEFIKKGLALYNAKNAFMEKFPDDVKYAESQTRVQTAKNSLPFINDRSDSIVKAVLSDGRLRKSTDYYESGQADISGGRNSREQSILRRDSVTMIMNMSASNRASLGSATSNATPCTNNASASSACQYRCNICDFTTMRQNVLIMHRKSHSSGTAGAPTPARNSLSLPQTSLSNSIIVKSAIDEAGGLNSSKSATTPLTTKHSKTIHEQQAKVSEEPATELPTPKRSRKKLSESPNSGSKRTTRSTPHSEPETIAAELPNVSDEDAEKAATVEIPQHTEKIRERLLADWSDEEKDEAEHLAGSAAKPTTTPEKTESSDNLQLPTTSAKSQAKRRTPTIVPMTALEGAGQTLVVGASTQATETVSKPPRIRNIPKKDRQREFEKNVDAEAMTEIKPTTTESSDAIDASTPTSTILVSLIKSAEKQKSKSRSKAENSAESNVSTAAGGDCYEFQEEEEDHEGNKRKLIADYKNIYSSPEKEKPKSKEERELIAQRDMELTAEINTLLEDTKLKTDAVPVKGLPIKERGKRIFKSRNRSRLDEDDDEASSTAVKQTQATPETANEETPPKTERKLRGRNTPQMPARNTPINGKPAENAQLATEAITEPTAVTATTPTPKRRHRKTHNNRIMQQLIDEEEASIPFIRHSPVELYGGDVVADVGATLVRERGRRSKTSTPNSLPAFRDEVVNGNSGNAVGGCSSRASSRNLIAPPLTPTDETSSFGISEAGAEFGSPASSLDEERLLTPLETPSQSEYGNDSESCQEKLSTELAEDDDEIESPQHEALSGSELEDKKTTTRRQKSPKKKTENKSHKTISKTNLADCQTLERKATEGDLPKRSLRRNHRVELASETSEEIVTEKFLKGVENKDEVIKETTHRKTRATRSQTPLTTDQKVETPTSNLTNADGVSKAEKAKKSTETKNKAEIDDHLVTPETTLDEEAVEIVETEIVKESDKTEEIKIDTEAVANASAEPPGDVNLTVNPNLQAQNQTEDVKKSNAVDVDKIQNTKNTENKPKERKNHTNESNEQTAAEHTTTDQIAAEKVPAKENPSSLLTVKETVSSESKQTVSSESKQTVSSESKQTSSLSVANDDKNGSVDQELKSTRIDSPTTSTQKIEKITNVAVLGNKPKSSANKAQDSESGGDKSDSRSKTKTPVDEISKSKQPKHHADDGKQTPSNSASRKRRAELDESLPQNHKSKKEDNTESLKLDELAKHQRKPSKRDPEKDKDSQEKSRPISPKKQHHKSQTTADEKSKTTAKILPSPAVEITRINVDVANPLSKHPSIVASMQQQHSNASKSRSPKHKMVSPLKRKLSHEIIGEIVDANNDAVVAHVQSLCPQVKITRKERLIEPMVDAAIPEKLLATPKKSATSPDISQMPIVLSSEVVEVSSPTGLVSSSLWQTDLLQPPPTTTPSEQQQTPPQQKRVGFDPRGQKYIMRQSPTQTAVNSPPGNGRLSPQKPPSASAIGSRKQAGNTPSMPVKQQQHKFAEALALADSILAPSVKPTKRRSSQQAVSNSNTLASNTVNSIRRFSSAAAIDTKTTPAATAASPAKIPKQMSKEVRSKSSSPTKMQSGNSSGSGSNSPALKSRLQTQQSTQKQKQTDASSDGNTKAATTALPATAPVPAPTTTLITATAAVDDAQTVVEAEQLNSAAKITAVPIQPIPGYAETFMLCMLVDDVYKPINNIPHYLNKDLNQLVPVPPEAYEGILPEFVVEQPQAADAEISPATSLSASSTMTTPSGKSSSIVSSREGGESVIETSEENELRVGLQLDESMLVGNVDAAAITVDADAVEASTDNAIVLKLENQHIILDAASFEQLLANPDANTQLLLEDGTEFVLTREVLAALKAQHDDQTAELLAIPADQQQQQQLQDQLIATEAGSSADLLSVALANSEFYGGEMLQIETTLGVAGGADAAGLQLLASDGSIVFQAPPLPQAHLTPPITAHTSETNAVLNQTPIMSTLEKPSTGKAGIDTSPTVVTGAVDGDLIGARPNLDDSLAVIGVTTQSSTVPSSLELPITITNPAIAPKVSLAGAHATATDLVQFQPRRSVATAAVAASQSVANVQHIYDDSIDNIN